ncbi:uncharacterized protein LOC134254018 [Saccostrea cucullata]|uniref:uncharacterized protein LOC134254018 n=1 Tax=Saccostrea cuccullata TaxID=36930 RepID=UPI002ED30900
MTDSSSIRKVNEITIEHLNIAHLSALEPDRFLASDDWGNLIQSDMKGSILWKKSTNMYGIRGRHSVTSEGQILYTDFNINAIYTMGSDMFSNKLAIRTGNWKPGAIYSSHINEHVLVGMEKNNFMEVTAKIVRFSKGWTKLQDINLNDKGQNLYLSARFITENINCDICTSDYLASKVVVVTRTGEYRFSYYGHPRQIGFRPCGICTDAQGHIVVCNGYEDSTNQCSGVHLLDMDGQFLSFLLTPDQCPPIPCALCINNQQILMIASLASPTVSVYKYFHSTQV